MKKKDLVDLETEDCKTITENIKKDNQNNCGFIKIVKNLTGKNWIEQNRFVRFNVVEKEKNVLAITGVRTSIGYILPNKTIYDFISSDIYEIYKLKDVDNKEKSGEYALINNFIFETSNKKLHLTYDNINKIELLLEKYIEEYKKDESYVRNYKKDSENEEHIPEFSRRLSRF